MDLDKKPSHVKLYKHFQAFTNLLQLYDTYLVHNLSKIYELKFILKYFVWLNKVFDTN